VLQRDRDWIEAQFKELHREVIKVQLDIATLKVKATIWGLCGGAIPVAISIGVYVMAQIL
jgi:hypothetical protein